MINFDGENIDSFRHLGTVFVAPTDGLQFEEALDVELPCEINVTFVSSPEVDHSDSCKFYTNFGGIVDVSYSNRYIAS